jgi:hypothetical protein
MLKKIPKSLSVYCGFQNTRIAGMLCHSYFKSGTKGCFSQTWLWQNVGIKKAMPYYIYKKVYGNHGTWFLKWNAYLKLF